MSAGESMKKKITKIIALLMPLILAIIWLLYVVIANRTVLLGERGMQLAPVRDTAPLVIGLSVFILGYVVFVVMMFSEDLKEMMPKKMPMKKLKKHKKHH
jgi:hypothetical protein